MPLPGRVGAISAANRRNRQRSQGSMFDSSKSATGIFERPRAAPTKKSPPCDTTSCISTDTKQSVLTRFKHQVSETSGFLKKQHHAFTDKVTKGLKMVAGMSAAQKRDAASDAGPTGNCDEPMPNQLVGTFDAVLDPSWLSALEDMGFIKEEIIEAVGMLGGQPDHMDDLLQVLLAMNASPDMIDEQSDGKMDLPDVSDAASTMLSDARSSSNPHPIMATSDTLPIGKEEKDLAASVVASAVVKAVVALGWQQDEPVMAKVDKPVQYFTRPSVGPTPIISSRARQSAIGAVAPAGVAATLVEEEVAGKTIYRASPIVGGA